MRPFVLRVVRWAALLGLVALAVAMIRPGQRALVVDAYVLLLGALALLILVAVTRSAVPAGRVSAFDRALEPPRERATRPASLESLEREVLLASVTAFDLHFRLRPVLRQIAAHRLSLSRGIDLDSDPEAARPLLAPEAWELVRPDREPPRDRHGPGRPLAELRAAVDSLEAVR